MLKTANIQPFYATGAHEPQNFFLAGLLHSVQLDLSLGYFRSTGFGALAMGFADFIYRGGQMRFMINNTLYHKDKDAIIKGQNTLPQDLVEQHILDDIEQLQQTLSKRDRHFFNCLSWMIANKTLEIKAVKPAKNKPGIVHHKFGIFTDAASNSIVFNGSVNFSEYAFRHNVEALSCDCSWEATGNTQKRMVMMTDDFENAWQGKSDVVTFIPVEAVKTAIQEHFPVENLEQLIDAEQELLENMVKEPETRPYARKQLGVLRERLQAIPSEKPDKPLVKKEQPVITLRPYQQEAIENWKKNDYKGMLEMATGTGKTFTALAAMQQLVNEKKRLQVIISCPFIHLAEQWIEEAAKFGFTNAILIGDSRAIWEDKAARQAQLFKRKKLDQVLFITTNASFSSAIFRKIIQPALEETLLIIDEVHYAGASVIRKFLPERCPFRLGLSATLERHGDETGTAALFGYFNKIVFSLPIEDAIGKYLANYYYHPIPVELSLEEFREYAKLSVRILHLRNSKKEDAGERMKMLLIKRAKIQNNSVNKLEWLRTALHDKPTDYSLFYAGDQIFDEAKKILGKAIGIRIHEFTSRQNRETRKKLLREFSNQEIQSLIAMKCLDEGVDVPPTRIAYFLASSGNPREFVQRRGRVLRLYPGKEEAIIYDLIAIPPRTFIDEGRSGEHYHAVKSAFAKEYRRVQEFAAMSLNRYAAMNEMFEMANRLDILDTA